MSNHLGKISFLDTPDVNGANVLTTLALTDPVFAGTNGLVFPSGTTAQRPASPTTSQSRFNTNTTTPEIYNGAAWLPFGKVIQMVSSTITSTSFAAAQITPGNTVPTSAQGASIWTATFTPLLATSTILILTNVTLSHATSGRVFVTSLFAGTTNIGTGVQTIPVANGGVGQSFVVAYQPGSTAAISLSMRTGTNGTGTMYINQLANATLGAVASDIQILEII